MSKLLNSEIEKRLEIKLDRSFQANGTAGIMNYGSFNSYPQIIEKLIFGSQTAKACAGIYAKFIGGDGFENEAIGKVVIGKDNKGKPITLDHMRRSVSESLSKFHGVYIHCNENLFGEVGDTRVIPFKYVRLSKMDDTGYCGQLAVHNNWTKESDLNSLKTFKKSDISWFKHFNLIEKVLQENVKADGGIEKFKGQIYSLYLDDNYLYPLSPFDSVYNDMDTEYQIQLFKNREIRNGFTDKVILNIVPPEDSKEEEETIAKIKNWMGPDGEKVLIFESEFDENGDLKKDGSFKLDKIQTNMNDKLFEGWEKSLSNNIRKAAKGMPAILIDYEMGTLGAASGEMIIQAVNYYNAMTQTLREAVSEMIKDIYSHHVNPILKENTNWKLKDTTLIATTTANTAEDEKLKAQANLRGSVGGVTSLITLQQAVSAGTSDLEAAVNIVKEIYGISEDVARSMIGSPKPAPITANPLPKP